MELKDQGIFVIIPAYRCKKQIGSVIQAIPPFVSRVFVVDDACPEGTGLWVQKETRDPRVEVLFHPENRGVGGAMVTGFQRALAENAQIVVKLDGDGQMDPLLIPDFVLPILTGRADYTKGNRFFNPEGLSQMPAVRLFGNAALSFLNKLVSGYWNVMDPTNGYLAIHTDALRLVPLSKLANRYFFESDLLFRLGTLRAVVHDIAMPAKYADEVSNLRIGSILLDFPTKYLNRFLKRIFYNYFLRDFTAGSLFLVGGVFLTTAGLIHGIYNWIHFYRLQVNAPTGTVMATVLLLLVGFQMLMSFLQQDIASVPSWPLHRNRAR